MPSAMERSRRTTEAKQIRETADLLERICPGFAEDAHYLRAIAHRHEYAIVRDEIPLAMLANRFKER